MFAKHIEYKKKRKNHKEHIYSTVSIRLLVSYNLTSLYAFVCKYLLEK